MNMKVNMKINLTSLRLMALMIVSGSVLVGCSANAPTDGICTRTCGSRVIGGGRLVGIPHTDSLSLICSNAKDAGTYEFRFLIYEDRSAPGGESGTPSANTAATKAEADTPKRIPRGGIAFVPNIVGRTANIDPSARKENDVSGLPPHTSTPSSEWCTDSCGYATLEVTPSCVEGEVNVGIIVPGNTGEATNSTGSPIPSVKISIAKPET